MTIKADRLGRIVIPKEMREHLGISPGTSLSIKEEQGQLAIKVLYNDSSLVEKDGLLVYTGKFIGSPNDEQDWIKKQRKERIDGLMEIPK